MTVIGLTGSFGTGKTFVASIFRSLGAKIIDADDIAHNVIRRGRAAHKRIMAEFGSEVLGPSREIDRRKLGRSVFGSRAKAAKLNRIVHPEVIRRIKRGIKSAASDAMVVIDAPLLIEAGLLNIVDKLVVVTCPKKRQIERCRKKFRLERREVLKRIRSQMSMKKKLKMADFVVQNGLSRAVTRSRVRKVWEEIVWR